MEGRDRIDQSRRIAAGEAKRLLGLAVLTEDALFELARTALGMERAARCLELAKLAPLTRRSVGTSATAELIVGTRALGAEWWSTVHRDLAADRRWIARGTPDELLAARQEAFASRDHAGSCLATLGRWVADDAADAQWGTPIDFVDLNDPRTDDRVVLPEDAEAGDRLIAAWDPGGRTYVHIVERDGSTDPLAEKEGRRRGSLGSQLGEHWYHDAAEADWAWAIATDTGPIRLPGEIPGTPTDPFAADLDADVADRLRAWAAKNGATAEQLGGAWHTKGDLWSARFQLGLPYSRPAIWWEFDRAASAAVDGDSAALAEALSRLDG